MKQFRRPGYSSEKEEVDLEKVKEELAVNDICLQTRVNQVRSVPYSLLRFYSEQRDNIMGHFLRQFFADVDFVLFCYRSCCTDIKMNFSVY